MCKSIARSSPYVVLVATSTLRAEYKDVTRSGPVGRRHCFWGICCIHFRGRRACRLFYFLLHFQCRSALLLWRHRQQVEGRRGVLFHPEDRDITLPRKVCTCLTDYIESKLSRQKVFFSTVVRTSDLAQCSHMHLLCSNYTKKKHGACCLRTLR